jgi:hypothetical protein
MWTGLTSNTATHAPLLIWTGLEEIRAIYVECGSVPEDVEHADEAVRRRRTTTQQTLQPQTHREREGETTEEEGSVKPVGSCIKGRARGERETLSSIQWEGNGVG